MRRASRLMVAFTAGTLFAVPALAWHMDGHVFCEGSGLPPTGTQVLVVSLEPNVPFSGSAPVDETGHYFLPLPNVASCFRATLALNQGGSVVVPATGEYLFCTTDSDFEIHRDWLTSDDACGPERCWMTGGGAKFSAICDLSLAECGRWHNFGGNVNPGCSPVAGDGGSWNHIDALLRRHFHGTHIEVVRCGNVDGIPPGSTSPVTPFNFIEFQGTGTLKGIKGNKEDFGTVHFFSRCEDRNEPGSNGQRDGAFKDRYFLHVFSNVADPAGSTLLLVDLDGDPSTVDPVTITDGNFQIHISSCDTPPLRADGVESRLQPAARPAGGPPASPRLTLAAPNPVRGRAEFRLGLPAAAEASLAILDVAGRKVRELTAGRLPAGEHVIAWDLRDALGARVGSGVYFAHLRLDGRVIAGRVAVVE